MCGIAGIAFDRSAFDCLEKMTNALHTRGPDSAGFWSDDDVALGHRRLAIIDLSPGGCQPMVSASGRYVIAFNGEIYNFKTLRRGLEEENIQFKSHSDTEVMLAMIEEYGVEEALKKFNGMFAFALWDRKEKMLSLVIDRFGEKPLYYGWSGRAFIFGSELKALTAYKNFNKEIDRDAIVLLLKYAYIQAPKSIYKNVNKLEPGYLLQITGDKVIKKTQYWSAVNTVNQAKQNPLSIDFNEATDQLDVLLTKSIEEKMMSDVALGAFLSGGVDSSTVVALMQKQASQKVQTFSIGFHEAKFNEAHYAKAVANYLGTEHHELYVTYEDALKVVQDLPTIYDEPFADSSQIPTYLLSKLTRNSVTVALSGDAGDEIFGGYYRYFAAKNLLKYLVRLPKFSRKSLAFLLNNLPCPFWDFMGSFTQKLPFKTFQVDNFPVKIQKLASVLQVNNAQVRGVYHSFISQNLHAAELVLGAMDQSVPMDYAIAGGNEIEWMMLMDTVSYLPGDILTKVDRAAMASSLETRIPFLDKNVFEFAWRLPFNYKIDHGEGKCILKNLLCRYLPKELIDRPKTGFGIPINQWLRTSLKQWGESLLSPSLLESQGYLNVEKVRTYWDRHQAGQGDYSYLLWNILAFQNWITQ